VVSHYLRSVGRRSQCSKAGVFAALPARSTLAPSLPSLSAGKYEATNTSPGEETIVITILLVILILMLVGVVPAWPHSRNWGYAPSSTVGLLVLILLILLITGRV